MPEMSKAAPLRDASAGLVAMLSMGHLPMVIQEFRLYHPEFP